MNERRSGDNMGDLAENGGRHIAAGSPLARLAYFGLGWLFVPLGAIGLLVPLMPGTVFLILAAACFARSSPRFEEWLVTHRYLGPSVRAWRANGAIPRRVKWVTCVSLVVSYGVLLLTDAPLAARIAAAVCFLAVAVYVITRPEPAASA